LWLAQKRNRFAVLSLNRVLEKYMFFDLSNTMRPFILKLAQVLIMLYASSLFALQTGADSSGLAYIKISRSAQEIVVILDGDMRIEKDSVLAVSPGVHRIEGFHPDKSLWLRPAWKKDIECYAEDTTVVVIMIPYVCWIDTEPTGASVFINEEFKGITPVSVTIPRLSDTRILLRRKGYRDYIADADEIKKRVVCLKMLPVKSFSARRAAIGKRWVVSTAVLSLAANVSGYILKRAADKEYGRYLSAANPDEMNNFFNNTQKLDNYSALSYAVGQISLGLSVYFLIRIMQTE